MLDLNFFLGTMSDGNDTAVLFFLNINHRVKLRSVPMWFSDTPGNVNLKVSGKPPNRRAIWLCSPSKTKPLGSSFGRFSTYSELQ